MTTPTVRNGVPDFADRGRFVPGDNGFQMASGKGCVRFRRLDDFQNLGAMSPNGRYVGGYTAEIPSGNTWYYTPVIIDTETGERQAARTARYKEVRDLLV